VKVKFGGGHGGHNGLRDIMKHFSGKDFVRVRVGVSRPPPGWDVANYVLAPWTGDEQDQLEDVMRRAADAVEVIVSDGAKSAMNQINQRRSVTSEAPSANSDAGSLT
jgi:PTH1 family peptidyl-tRNA hydrolase